MKYHLERFEKTTEQRRRTVLAAAVAEFSVNGFDAANINTVAEAAGISIGAMYTYFRSKEDLFLAVIDHAYRLMDEVLTAVANKSGTVFEYVDNMLAAARRFAQEQPELNRLYLAVTTQPSPPLPVPLSRQIESTTPKVLEQFLTRAQEDGYIAAAVDRTSTAWCIDNLFMMYQFSFASDYYRERLAIYLGDRVMDDPGQAEAGISAFIRRSLRPD